MKELLKKMMDNNVIFAFKTIPEFDAVHVVFLYDQYNKPAITRIIDKNTFENASLLAEALNNMMDEYLESIEK